MIFTDRQATRPRPDDAPHPFKGKVVTDIQPIGPWWRKGWVIRFTDGTWFSTHPNPPETA